MPVIEEQLGRRAGPLSARRRERLPRASHFARLMPRAGHARACSRFGVRWGRGRSSVRA
jgi:hypothetical protein